VARRIAHILARADLYPSGARVIAGELQAHLSAEQTPERPS
jgi:hypothetical protein